MERAKLDVEERESKLRFARHELEIGKRKLQCDVDAAQANYRKSNEVMLLEVALLTEAVRRAGIYLEMEKANLKRCETTLAKGFEEN